MVERDVMAFDVVIVGAGPAGLSAAIQLRQLAQAQSQELSVCVLEKGAEVGAHILSGAVFEPRALNELLPDWADHGAPLTTAVSEDELYWLPNTKWSWRLPKWMALNTLHNQGNYIISLGSLCRWLAEQAQALGVEIFPGFAAKDVLYDAQGRVQGVITGDMGLDKQGQPKDSYMPGIELHAKQTLFAEGCRGHLGKQLIQRYALATQADPQHYALGIKELWQVSAQQHQPGKVVHALGWPLLERSTSGGAFLYHLDQQQVVVGLITDLNYANPHLSPFDEFQRMKHHPLFAQCLRGGQRIAYGARALAKGGLQSLPKMHFPGGLLIGCEAGTLNFAKIKGSHTAMKSGMLAAQTVFAALQRSDAPGQDLADYAQAFAQSWLYQELHQQRNVGPAMHKLGSLSGAAYAFIDVNLCHGRLPWTFHDAEPDAAQMDPADQHAVIDYAKPDNQLSFDKNSSVFLSNTQHEDNQPCHLQLQDAQIPMAVNWPQYAEPAQRYCPAGVYEVVQEGETLRFQINAQNCVHCKTCDIKDPSQNIHWTVPEGGGGPGYPNM